MLTTLEERWDQRFAAQEKQKDALIRAISQQAKADRKRADDAEKEKQHAERTAQLERSGPGAI